MSESSDSRGMSWGVFIPVLMLAGVVAAQTVLEGAQLRSTRTLLDTQFEQQRTTMEESQKLRGQLEAIAGDTAALAESGNENAIRLRDYLRQQGVTIRPPGAAQQ